MATLLSSLETQARRQLMEVPELSTPAAPTVTTVGTAGATTWQYKIVAINATGSSIASAAGSTATGNGNATLTASNLQRLAWTAVTGAQSYWIFRTAVGTSPSTTGRIAVVGEGTLTFDDTGFAGDSDTAPTVNTTILGNPFWTSAELIALINLGIKDLWGAIIDLHQEHFLTVDTSSVSYTTGDTSLTGVPSDCFRVHVIEPADTSVAGSYRNLLFIPRDYNSNEFILARSMDTQDPTMAVLIYYCLTNAGAPVAAPSVLVGPKLSITLAAGTIRFVYVPTLADVAASGNNPIPGASDQALIAWCVAYARSKEKDDRSPDPAWLAVYATEKQNLLTRLTPRQTQEPDVVQDFFDNRW